MNSEDLENYYERGHSCRGAGILRFVLMAFVCVWSFGFPEPTGFLNALSGFAAPCFFILSGFFVLVGNKEDRIKKTKRKIKRSLLCFGFMIVLYTIMNIIVCIIGKISVTFSLRTIFNFIVLNLWPLPIGTNIWFVQAMLYTYALIYIAEKLNLMKYYKTVLVISFIIMLLFGEFAGAIHFDFHGYQYIPGNWFTRALPYMLLGMLMREKNDILLKINDWQYILLIFVGAVMAISEIILLGQSGLLIYEGHMIGYAVMAFSACGLAVTNPKAIQMNISITRYDTAFSGMIYIFLEPIYYALVLFFRGEDIDIFTKYLGIAAFLLSILIAVILKKSFIATIFFSKWDERRYRKIKDMESKNDKSSTEESS